ncbi:MAG: type II secretion system protein, partial [Kiritimatiellae bacterium]|nr:type II secretion system protein [Kiritimatiellia bacterium]
MRRTGGFTLVELLVVLAIMALLLGIVLPTVLNAPVVAKLEKARAEVANLDMAIKAFEREYKVWPDGLQSGGVRTFQRDLVEIMTGLKVSGDRNKNPNRRPFIEVGALSTNASGELVDPWDQPYKCAVDHNFDNLISTDGGTVTGRTTAVWSSGDPKATPQTII